MLIYSLAVRFYRTRALVAKARPEAVAALTQLSVVALIAFFGYILVAIANLPWLTEKMIQAPGTLAALQLMKLVSVSMRGLAVLWVLGVRVPKNNGENSVTGSTTTLVAEDTKSRKKDGAKSQLNAW